MKLTKALFSVQEQLHRYNYADGYNDTVLAKPLKTVINEKHYHNYVSFNFFLIAKSAILMLTTVQFQK